jgi:hypothetical protein
MFYEINILVIFKFLCYLLIMNIIHWCLQYGLCLVFLEMFLYFFFWFVLELSCMYLLHPETCFSVLSAYHGAFSFFIIFISRVLYIHFCVGGVQYKAYVFNMLCMRACLCICLQQLTNFYESWFVFYANGGCLRRHTNSVWNIAYKNRRLYPINFKCRHTMRVCAF